MGNPPNVAGQLSRMLYMDDSGSARSQLAILGWVEVAPRDWPRVLRVWLDVRKSLVRDFGVEVHERLHATEFMNGRKRITKAPPVRYMKNGEVLWKDLGRDVAQRCLETLRDCDGLTTGAVYRRHHGDGKVQAKVEYALYRDFIVDLDAEVRGADTYAHVSMDGADPHYRDAHRALPLDSRRIIEDPVMQSGGDSQWVQMADLVAYCANLTLDRHSANEFGWDWYSTYLAPRDRSGGPIEMHSGNS
jgi:hypothetical protein